VYLSGEYSKLKKEGGSILKKLIKKQGMREQMGESNIRYYNDITEEELNKAIDKLLGNEEPNRAK